MNMLMTGATESYLCLATLPKMGLAIHLPTIMLRPDPLESVTFAADLIVEQPVKASLGKPIIYGHGGGKISP